MRHHPVIFHPLQIQRRTVLPCIGTHFPPASAMDYVIPPPAPQAPEVSHAGSYLRVKYLLVDSRHRDHRRYPNANNYVIDLPTDFRDVTRIRLVQWDVPRAQATVRSSHATLAVLHHHPTYDEADDKPDPE